MFDLSRRWPFGLNRKTWPDRVAAALMLLFALLFIDAWASQTLQAWPDVWRAPFAFVTDFGLSDWVLIPSALVFALAAVALRLPLGRYRLAIYELGLVSGFVFIGVGLPGLMANLLKRLIGRARPEHFLDAGAFQFHQVVNAWDFQSFPSGHSTTAMATALIVGFMVPRFFPAILVIAVMTGLSRVVIGMHYPTDVASGFLLGIIGAYAVRNVFARRRWLFVNRTDGSVRFRGVPNLSRLLRRWFHRARV
ncbi:MAG: phosphatase PAP2 family protein [Alphaproteobacteria bacterium]|nr:phosphatase PAP2 family protein [Alphaproteobacteria bacterium]